jgi:hypothetical protein
VTCRFQSFSQGHIGLHITPTSQRHDRNFHSPNS